MKTVIIWVMVIAVIVGAAWLTRDAPRYVAGRIYIKERGISAEVYTSKEEPLDGMSSLWNGGKVTTHADLSSVQVGDMADLYTVEGEHLVLECIGITGGPAWLLKADGDVLVVNGHVYRFIRL